MIDDAPGFDEMPLCGAPAPAAPDRGPARKAAGRRRLRARFLRAGREAVDDRELLELLLAGHHAAGGADALATSLLEMFGTAPRALAARTDRLRAVPGLCEDAIAALKAAEALGIRMARADLPETLRPSLGSYDKVIDYCRALAGHCEVEEFHILYLNRRNRLIRHDRHQTGTVDRAPIYPREVCMRSLEAGATALIAVHNHPSGDPAPSRADIDTTKRMRDALRTIEVILHDHIVVTPTGAVSFQAQGLL